MAVYFCGGSTPFSNWLIPKEKSTQTWTLLSAEEIIQQESFCAQLLRRFIEEK